ncbi:MAG: hypothetical protein HEP71_03665 [Roseivirga sp.]|nr:hypothetical protein [Roseivirga sp.]
MKRLFVVIFFVTLCVNLKAQSFYEIKWKSDLDYTALVVYYDESQIEVRVKYTDSNNIYRVAKYSCDGSIETDDNGVRYFVFDGHDAEVVYSSDNSPSSYIADNFIFTNLNENNEFEYLYTMDDSDVDSDDSEPVEASYRPLDPQTDFTQQYIFNFFDAHEPEYNSYLGLVNTVEPDPVIIEPDPVTQPERAVMHLVMVADVEDRSIGKSTAQDQRDVTTTFTKISRELGIEIKEYQFSGNGFNRDSILTNLNRINNSPNDIIIYYYSGHGYNDPGKDSEFPSMALDGVDLSLEDMYYEIRDKNARLTMIIGDMCNSIPESRAAVGRREALPFKSGYLFDNTKLSKLFLQSSGFLVSTSSQKGEWSYCMNNPDGTMGNGQFTHAFIESMIKEASAVSASDADWLSLFGRAYRNANLNTQGLVNQNGQRGQSGFNRSNIKY